VCRGWSPQWPFRAKGASRSCFWYIPTIGARAPPPVVVAAARLAEAGLPLAAAAAGGWLRGWRIGDLGVL
jgi:hypothetical protein